MPHVAGMIKFLVAQRFPGTNAPPPPPTIAQPNRSSRAEWESYEIRQEDMASYKADLAAMPPDELIALYETEWGKAGIESQEREERKERDRFFNQSRAIADSSWKHAALVTVEEAIALAFDKEPGIVNWDGVRPYVNVSPFAKKYKLLRNLAVRAIAANVLPNPVIPKAFAIWLQSIEHDMPSWMTEMVNSQSVVSPEDAQSDSSVIESDGAQESGTTKATPPGTQTAPEWRVRSEEIGAKAYREDTDLLKKSIARLVEDQLAVEGWRGRGGRLISFDNIMRNGLKCIFNSNS